MISPKGCATLTVVLIDPMVRLSSDLYGLIGRTPVLITESINRGSKDCLRLFSMRKVGLCAYFSIWSRIRTAATAFSVAKYLSLDSLLSETT